MKTTGISQAVRTCAALALLLTSSSVLNGLIFPHVETVSPVARDTSTYLGVAFFIALAVLAYRRPSVFIEKLWTVGTFVASGIGFVFLYAGISYNMPTLLLAGSFFGGIVSVWFTVLVCISLTKLNAKQCALCIPLAFVIQYLFVAGLSFFSIPLLAAIITYMACLLVAYLLIAPYSAPVVATIRNSASPTELDITSPSSFLPFSHPVFISIFLFNAAWGYAFTFQTDATTLPQSLLSFLPVLVIFLIMLIGHKNLNADKLFLASALLVFAGFLLVPLSLLPAEAASDIHFSTVFLRSGADCFTLLIYFLIAAMGARNELGSITLAALTMGSSWLGIGGGALLGQITHAIAPANPYPTLLLLALLTFVFVVYNFVFLKGFSFKATIEGIQPIRQFAEVGDDEESPTLDEQCEAVAVEFGLTAREVDVLKLLARGRTSPIIQEKLFLSHNTVKTHVRHIYMKLEVHSQQELIDIVEAADPYAGEPFKAARVGGLEAARHS